MDLDRSLLDRMRSQAGTRRTRRENATALRGLLRWGATQDEGALVTLTVPRAD